MNLISRTITGIIMIFVGLGVIGVSFITSFFILIYGLPILVIGIVIFLNKGEDKIEQIKSKKKLKISTHSNLKNSNEKSSFGGAFFKSKIKKTQRRSKK